MVPHGPAADQDSTDLQKCVQFVRDQAAARQLALRDLTLVALGEPRGCWGCGNKNRPWGQDRGGQFGQVGEGLAGFHGHPGAKQMQRFL